MREKINRGQQGQLIIPEIFLLEWQLWHNHPFLGIFNTFIIWIAITGLVLIEMMVINANCLSISTHWHQPWWLFKKRGYQGVTGITRFTWYCSDLAWITFPGLLLLVPVILALKIMHFQPPWERKAPRFISVSAKSARERNHSSSWIVDISANMRPILKIIFFLAPYMSGVQARPVWAMESTPLAWYGWCNECIDFFRTPGMC